MTKFKEYTFFMETAKSYKKQAKDYPIGSLERNVKEETAALLEWQAGIIRKEMFANMYKK